MSDFLPFIWIPDAFLCFGFHTFFSGNDRISAVPITYLSSTSPSSQTGGRRYVLAISDIILLLHFFAFSLFVLQLLFSFRCRIMETAFFKFKFIYSILYKPCIFKAYRLLNVQTLCIFPCFCPYEPKQGKFLFSADYLIQQSCGSTLRFPCSVSVNVHCGTNISVSE